MTQPKIDIRRQHRVVVLTGAGISAESGIKTFREAGGLWETHSIEDVATPEGFRRNPRLVWEFYNQRRRDLKGAEPNPGHRALAKLQSLLGANLILVTQNVDDLHERAGSTGVIHMHGELNRVRCLSCDEVFLDDSELGPEPRCLSCGGRLRPHIVWFGEIPFFMGTIQHALFACDWFLAVGTSGTVYPAAQFMQVAKAAGARTVCVNPDPAAESPHADYFVLRKAGEYLPGLVESLTL